MEITAIIVDDERRGRSVLGNLLRHYLPNVHVLGEADSVPKAVELIDTLRPELVFLDVEMPSGTGFDVLEGVAKRNFEVIFITAYDQYAISAFKVSAVDYLLKPINVNDLKSAVQRAVERNAQKSDEVRYRILLDHLNQGKPERDRIVLPTLDGFIVVKLEDIIRTQSEANYTRFFKNDGQNILVSKTMKEYSPVLEEYGFFRIHRSHYINMDYVVRYTRGRGGDVELSDGTVLAVARDRKDAFLRRFE